MPSAAFTNFWRTDLTRECFLSFTTPDDVLSLRLVCRDTALQIAPRLFNNVHINFNTKTFSRPARMAALDRIGYHIKTLTFHMLHNGDAFLPPLLNPVTGDEETFVYEPQITTSRPSSSDSRSSPTYGSLEMNELLIRQYPPLFHAATNIAAFTRAINAMPCLRHLHVSCPNQPTGQRYRRDIVDYALISLRIAIEQAGPPSLDSLSLAPIHPGAIQYLRPQFSVGSSPVSTKVWRRITKLDIEMESFSFGPAQPTDHLKILHTYLHSFQSLKTLHFRWRGAKGPCPLSLDSEPCTSRPSSLDCSQQCPEKSLMPSYQPLKFRKLRSMVLENAVLDASQAASFIAQHRKYLHDFQFDECHLRSGTWDDALAPLTQLKGNEECLKKQVEEVMDVPLILSPIWQQKMECVKDMMWNDDRKTSRGLQVLRGVTLRTKDMLGMQSVRRMLRCSRLKWH